MLFDGASIFGMHPVAVMMIVGIAVISAIGLVIFGMVIRRIDVRE